MGEQYICCSPAPNNNNRLDWVVSTKGSGTPTPTSIAYPTSTPIHGPPGMYTSVDLPKAIRLAPELFFEANNMPK